jgi:hypothetical protein
VGPPCAPWEEGGGGGDGSVWWDGEPSGVEPIDATDDVAEPSGTRPLGHDCPAVAAIPRLGVGAASTTSPVVRLSITTRGGLC